MKTIQQRRNTRTKEPKPSIPASWQVQPPQAGSELARSAALTAAQFLKEFDEQQQAQEALGRTPQEREPLVPAKTAVKGPRLYRTIKLGLDVHADRYVVVRQIDGGVPQPAQGFTPAQFLSWAAKQKELAEEVYCCYEAGPFGYTLHRQLLALGILNYLVRPRDWDDYGKKVKTDKRDAKELVLHLDRYVSGNRETFCVVRIPSETEEQSRSRSRQRESFQKEKQRLAAQGRSHALYYGARLEGEWWTEALWKELVLPSIVLELLEPLRRLIQAVDQELKAHTKAITAAAPEKLPLGLGKLTHEILEREICDWNRFENRRQVASYTGMCPREDTSAQRRFQGSINKSGNPRVRTVLVETAWRLVQFQPTYKTVAKWLPQLTHPKTTRSKRKQIAVAIGRQFTVDWWRVRTGRCQAESLGLKFKPAPPTSVPTPRAKALNAKGQA